MKDRAIGPSEYTVTASEAKECSDKFYRQVISFYEENRNLITKAIHDEIRSAGYNGLYECNFPHDIKSLCLQPRHLGVNDTHMFDMNFPKTAEKINALKDLIRADLIRAGYKVYENLICWDDPTK